MTQIPPQAPTQAPPLPADYSADRFEGVAVSLHEVFKANLLKTRQMTITGKTFEHCVIEGPAVLLASGGVQFDACNLGPAEGDMRNLLLKPMSPSKTTGVIAFKDCVFRRCDFFGVGYTGSKAFLDQMAAVGTNPPGNA